MECAPAVSEASRRLYTVGGTEIAVAVLGPYEAGLRRAIQAFKDGRRDVGDALAEYLVDRLVRRLDSALSPLPVAPATRSVLIPIPTTDARRSERGFDGATFLAERLSWAIGVSLSTPLLQVRGDRQRGRKRRERLEARGRFRLCRPERLAACEVILVDDVVTTGATLCDVARTFRRHGIAVRGALALAATPLHQRLDAGTTLHGAEEVP